MFFFTCGKYKKYNFEKVPTSFHKKSLDQVIGKYEYGWCTVWLQEWGWQSSCCLHFIWWSIVIVVAYQSGKWSKIDILSQTSQCTPGIEQHSFLCFFLSQPPARFTVHNARGCLCYLKDVEKWPMTFSDLGFNHLMQGHKILKTFKTIKLSPLTNVLYIWVNLHKLTKLYFWILWHTDIQFVGGV